MGKKHKKHKSEKKSRSAEEFSEHVSIPEKPEKSEKTEKTEKPPPLKLVLKVDLSKTEADAFSKHEQKKHKHKKKKKKKDKDKDKERSKDRHKSSSGRDGSSSHKRDYAQVVPVQEQVDEVPAKVPALDVVVDEPDESVVEMTEPLLPLQNMAAFKTRDGDISAVLRECLHYLHKSLQKRDVNGFFAFPVTDAIAPGYSQMINYPMDFSSLFTKIENDEIHSIMEYKKDFVTMCNNAVTYNRPETIYYKEAKKLLHCGLRLMSKEKLLSLRKTTPLLSNVTNEEIGMDDSTAAPAEMVAIIDEEEQRMKELKHLQKVKSSLSRFEAIPDNLTADEILAQAQAAAKEAKEELTLRKPNSRFGFLNRRKDGSTTMTVLNPDNDGIVSQTEKVVCLGELIGKVGSGSGSLAGYKEDKRNKVSLVTYLNYGPFSSYAPQYDASFANVSKEESDILMSAYGDETGMQYAKSVMNFVKDADECAIKMVDNLLDILTRGEHSKSKVVVEQKKQMEEEKKTQEKENEPAPADNAANVTETQDPVNDALQQRLDHMASLINDLQQTQQERLSSCPPPHLGNLPGPSEKETLLADKVSKELKALAREAVPKDLSSTTGLRQAMGITTQPTQPTQPTQLPVTLQS